MKEYRCVSQAFWNSPWAVLPEKLLEMDAILRIAILQEKAQLPEMTAGPKYQVSGRTAIIPVFGVLTQRASMFSDISGATSAEAIGRSFDAALADNAVKNIVLAVDSPGGSVFGIKELGDKILAGRDRKKVIASVDSIAASAAYWLASQAGEIVVTPGGQVGSIGVLAAHQDVSKAEEMAGVKTTLIHAGKYKVEGDSSMPLSSEAANTIQQMVDGYYSMFLEAVAKGRGVTTTRVEKDYGQGRMKMAEPAVVAGMADKVMTFEKLMQKLGADATEAARIAGARASYIARAAEIGA